MLDCERPNDNPNGIRQGDQLPPMLRKWDQARGPVAAHVA